MAQRFGPGGRGRWFDIVEDGLTGSIVDSVEAAASAVQKVARLNRRMIRDRFESRSTAARMAADYARVYQRYTPTPRSRCTSRTATIP
jgi:hypothetical protein